MIIVTLLAIVFALKLVEANGGLEFEGRYSAFVVALLVEFGSWGAASGLALVLPDPESLPSLNQRLGLMFGRDLIVTTALLLLAWATVPGVHIRRFFGLIMAAVLIVGLRFTATMFAARLLVAF